jgi:hypothetical protein
MRKVAPWKVMKNNTVRKKNWTTYSSKQTNRSGSQVGNDHLTSPHVIHSTNQHDRDLQFKTTENQKSATKVTTIKH